MCIRDRPAREHATAVVVLAPPAEGDKVPRAEQQIPVISVGDDGIESKVYIKGTVYQLSLIGNVNCRTVPVKVGKCEQSGDAVHLQVAPLQGPLRRVPLRVLRATVGGGHPSLHRQDEQARGEGAWEELQEGQQQD
eukprot:8618063-Alexandrium_andersonii.AAC.1